jgi:hypothetical protein
MKSSILAPVVSCMILSALSTLAGCTTADGQSRLASHDTTVEYYRVFDLRTDAPVPTVAQAASTGISRNLKDAVVTTPEGVQVAEQPGRFKMADPGSKPAEPAAPGAGAVSSAVASPNCEGAAWTAKAAPRVRGGDNMNVVACLFPYKGGYHLDMYAVFTKPEGGWLYWPRRLSGTILGTPERFTDDTMLDVVRAIRASTNAEVTLVEARPVLSGTPWLEPAKTAQAPAAVSQTGAPSPATRP